MKHNFSTNLKRIREDKGYTQRNLADVTNLSIKTITCYEMGVQECDFNTLLLLAETLECSTDDILGKAKNNHCKGYIYIFTNPEYKCIKIGYSKDVPERIVTLSLATGVPKQFELYATYEVNVENADTSFHDIIDELDPELRVSKHKEFFNMPPEQAFKLLQKIAKIHNCNNGLQRFQSHTTKNRKKTIDSVKTTNGLEWLNPDVKSTNVDFALVEQYYYAFIKMKKAEVAKGKTRDVLAQKTGYSKTTIKRCIKIIKEADLNTKQMVREGELTVNAAYDILNISFSEMQIPKGAILQYCNDASITCEVISEHRVMYKGKCRTLTELAMTFLEQEEGVHGPDYFLYKHAQLRNVKGRQENI